ncbi:MAG: VanZ family protein, partial [Desulforhopalus sp.]
AATFIFACGVRLKVTNPRKVILFTLTFSLLYGISDEFHQSFIPGRFVSVYDLIADCAGAAVVCALWARWRKRRVNLYP